MKRPASPSASGGGTPLTLDTVIWYALNTVIAVGLAVAVWLGVTIVFLI